MKQVKFRSVLLLLLIVLLGLGLALFCLRYTFRGEAWASFSAKDVYKRQGQHVGIHGLTVLGGQMVLLAQGVGRTVQRHGPVDDVVQLGIAPNTADDQLVLQRQIAVVHHTQLRQGIGAARLPQNLLARSSLDPVQCLALGGDPAAVSYTHLCRYRRRGSEPHTASWRPREQQ